MNEKDDGIVTISVVLLTGGEHAIVLEFGEDEDLSLVFPPSMAESIATNMLSAVSTAREMGWKESDDECVFVHPHIGEPCKESN